ncbi:MAG: hypothetical protein R2932_24270 [Caldilineaceae bacterium]
MFAFLRQMAGTNRSAYINQLIKAEKERLLEARMVSANREEAADIDYQRELAEWNVTLTDGLGE